MDDTATLTGLIWGSHAVLEGAALGQRRDDAEEAVLLERFDHLDDIGAGEAFDVAEQCHLPLVCPSDVVIVPQRTARAEDLDGIDLGSRRNHEQTVKGESLKRVSCKSA